IAYHTAYLKANYTTEYMTAVLSAEMGTPDRIAIAVAECRRMGLAVLPPDVNESELDFAYTPKGIRFGLGAVKNVGEGAVEGLIAELGMRGQLEVKFGASPNSRFVDAPKEKLAWEKELLGIYLSAHPLNALAPRMKDVENLVALAELNEAGEDLVTIACVVTSARKHITKNKQLMMFAQVEDLTGSVEVTVFPRVYEATAPLWGADEILLVLARVEQRDEDPKLLCEHAVRFDDAGIEEIKRVADERRQFLAKRAKFTSRNGNAGSGVQPGAGGPAPSGAPTPASLRRTYGPGRDESVVPPAQR